MSDQDLLAVNIYTETKKIFRFNGFRYRLVYPKTGKVFGVVHKAVITQGGSDMIHWELFGLPTRADGTIDGRRAVGRLTPDERLVYELISQLAKLSEDEALIKATATTIKKLKETL